MTGAEIAVVRKNAREEIRVELSEFNGYDLVNIRVWAEPRDGIACRIELLPEIIAALQKAELKARNAGLLT